MLIIALPGRSVETETWMKKLLAAMSLPDATIIRYQHWDKDIEASVSFEAARLTEQRPQLVIAKSLGTVIAATAFHLHGFRPATAVLIGTPYAALPSGDIEILQRFAANVQTLFIQQTEDPGGAADTLSASLQLTQGIVAAVPGNDHIYSDTAALVAAFNSWRV
jgi:hypothetical protein